MRGDKQTRKATWGYIFLGLIIVAIVVAFVLWGDFLLNLFRKRDMIVDVVNRHGGLGPLIIIALQVAQTVLAPIPGHIVGAVGGYLFGLWLGTLYSMAGTLIGSLIILILVRRFGRPLVERFVSPDLLSRLDHYSRQRGSLFLLVAFLSPPIPSDMACLAAGLTDLPIPWIMVLVAIGRLPGVVMSVAVGAYALQISPTQWAIFAAALLIIAILFYRYGKKLEALSLRLIDRLLQ